MNALYLLEQMQKNNVDIEAFEFNRDLTSNEVLEQIKKSGGYLTTEYKIDKDKKILDIDFGFKLIELPKLPTEYQNLVCYCVFEEMFRAIFSVLPQFKARCKNDIKIVDIPQENIKFGTISNPKFNLTSYKVNKVEYLIVINEGVLSFLNEMSTLITLFLFDGDLTSYEILLNNLHTKSYMIKEFMLKMIAYYLFYHTWWGQKKQRKGTELFWMIRDAIADEGKKFVCAHELGHILLGHFEKENELWEKEFQEDKFASLIMFCEFDSHPAFPAIAMAMMLGVVECIDRMNGMFFGKDKTQHPLTYERVNNIGEIAFSKLGYTALIPFQLTRMLINILFNELVDFILYLNIEKGIMLCKKEFGKIQAILDKEYVLPKRDYEGEFDRWIKSGYATAYEFQIRNINYEDSE